MDRVTCDELLGLMKPADRVAVLILLQNEKPGAVGQIQFVTYGRSAEDKVESHQLKTFIQNHMYGGDVPPGVSHESFILDAAKNKQLVDACRAGIRDAVAAAHAGDEVASMKAILQLETLLDTMSAGQPNYRLHNSYWIAFRAIQNLKREMWNKEEGRWKTVGEIYLSSLQYTVGHAVQDLPTPESFYGEPQSTPTDPLHAGLGVVKEVPSAE